MEGVGRGGVGGEGVGAKGRERGKGRGGRHAEIS